MENINYNIISDLKRLKNNSKVKIIKTKTNYNIVSYKKECLNENYVDENGMLKNVIFHKNGQLMSIFPCKRIDSDYFLIKHSQYIGRELIEGDCFSLFWDTTLSLDGAWQIHEFDKIETNEDILDSKIKKKLHEFNKNKCNLIDYLNKKYIYHFSFEDNDKLYLLDIFLIEPEKKIFINRKIKDNPIIQKMHVHNVKIIDIKSEIQLLPIKNKMILIPKEYSQFETINKIKNYDTLLSEDKCEKGIELIDANGNRCKIMNNSYKYIKILQSIFPKNIYLYLHLRSVNKIFWNTKNNVLNKYIFQTLDSYNKLFIKTIYYKYKKIFIKKQNSLDSEKELFKVILIRLHNLYTSELRNKGEYCQLKHAIQVFKTFNIEEQMYFLTYLIRND